jgi:transcriptional regulator GlxA family with amidase domain
MQQRLYSVAVIVFDGVELLDFSGPAEVFIVADEGKSFRVHIVAESCEPIHTMGGVTIVPEYAVDSAPPPDIIVVPGGDTPNFGARGRAWLRSAAQSPQIVLSVCMGAFILAELGMLDGIEATTHHWGVEQLKRIAPASTVVSARRVVDAGKVVTTAGVTSGIDGALHIVERLRGAIAAAWIAEEWMEHHRITN